MEKKLIYTLQEIANWTKDDVDLPTVQRGFVWKPNQIENLWDSLLRGYPVGAFVLSPGKGNSYQILDGQQRATAICLGFSKKTFRDSQDFFKVFIDLELAADEDSRNFIFRVITRSHPWGYRKQDNSKTLTSENIRKAMDLYNAPDPLTAPLVNFFPFDASLPVPFDLFINAAIDKQSLAELKATIEKWAHWKMVKNRWLTNFNPATNAISEQPKELILSEKVRFVYEAVCQMLDENKGQRIPALYLDLNKWMNQDKPEAENAADEIENLFVRLNAGGTPLSGEELNYSIIKSKFKQGTQKTIEDAVKHLFKPARFITIAYRLFQLQPKKKGINQQNDALTMRIKPKQFQKIISTEADVFESFLLDITTKKKFQDKSLIDYTQEVLAYHASTKSFGLPFLLYSKISETAPELMFLLLYRIKFCDDRFSCENKEKEKEHRRMLGIITLFLWFGKGKKLKDHSLLLSNIWPAATRLNSERFWSPETIERATLNEVLLPFPSFKSNGNKDSLESIFSIKISDKTNILSKFEKDSNNDYRLFFEKIMYNKDLLLYAQRSFLETYFNTTQHNLQDTNVPFDWDHISPNKLVHSKRNIPQIINDWYQTIGNFRAWPYALNRMDSDNSPGQKLRPLNANNYETEEQLSSSKGKWNVFSENNPHLIQNLKVLDKKLLAWSFCENKWAECYISDIRTDWKEVVQLIINRNILIAKEWYDELLIDKIKDKTTIAIEDIIIKRYWPGLSAKDEAINSLFDVNEYTNWISRPITLNGSKLYFYISFAKGNLEHLQDNGIVFGIYEKAGGNFISSLKDKSKFEMDLTDFTWIENSFTLISGSQLSFQKLVFEIAEWLGNLPASKADKLALPDAFKKMISSKFLPDSHK